MSDNPTPEIDTIERLARAYAHDADGTLPLPPAPRISEEEIQRVNGALEGSWSAINFYWEQELMGTHNERKLHDVKLKIQDALAILRTLNEVK